MKDSKKLADIAKMVFAAHTAAKVFYFTSDGQAFSEKSDAVNHGRSLEDKEVTEVTRAMAVSGNISFASSEQKSANEDQGKAKNEFQATGTRSESTLGAQGTADPERDQLVKRHEELSGKKPVANIGMDKLRERVAELEKAATEPEPAPVNNEENQKSE